jgi:hypothetical protein
VKNIVQLVLVVAVTALGVIVYFQENDIRSQQQLIEQLTTNVNSRSPTATEEFHLRSECAALAQKILDGNTNVDPALARSFGVDQSVDSNYDPKANRCYVELSTQTTNSTAQLKSQVANYYLFDGQTGSELAFAISQNGQQVGMVFVQHTPVPNATPHDDALQYINDIMNAGQ